MFLSLFRSSVQMYQNCCFANSVQAYQTRVGKGKSTCLSFFFFSEETVHVDYSHVIVLASLVSIAHLRFIFFSYQRAVSFTEPCRRCPVRRQSQFLHQSCTFPHSASVRKQQTKLLFSVHTRQRMHDASHWPGYWVHRSIPTSPLPANGAKNIAAHRPRDRNFTVEAVDRR